MGRIRLVMVFATAAVVVGSLAPVVPAHAVKSGKAPAIRSFTPTSGPVGASVRVSGHRFGGTTSVTFNGTSASFTVVSKKQIITTVPDGASTGPITVTTPGGSVSSSQAFTVTLPGTGTPATVSVDPTVGPPTTNVSVSGSGFGGREAVDIYFDTTDEALASTDSTGSFSGISISVPASATPGTHWITAVGRRHGVSAQTRFVVRTNWAQFGFIARHSGYNPFENVLSASDVPGLGAAWSYTTGGSVESSPAVANGVVYVGSADGNVYALDASTGAKLWSYKLWSYTIPGGFVESSPAVANGVVYVGSFDGNVYALDASTGAKLWSYPTGDLVESSPAVANGVVYVGSFDYNVYALNASTGAKLWSYTTPYAVVSSSPAVANGVVYVGSNNGNVYALNASTGAKLWSYTTPGGAIESSPAVANGVVYVGSDDGNVYALNASTGAKLWSYTTGGFVFSSPAVANGVVYVGSGDHNVYALDASTGVKLWSYTTGDFLFSSPAVANGVVYVGSDDRNVYAFDLAPNKAANAVARPSATQLKPNRSLRPSN